ncbi:MAG: hypothetical protein OCC49_11035 [Fibrobacterales bacterium]
MKKLLIAPAILATLLMVSCASDAPTGSESSDDLKVNLNTSSDQGASSDEAVSSDEVSSESTPSEPEESSSSEPEDGSSDADSSSEADDSSEANDDSSEEASSSSEDILATRDALADAFAEVESTVDGSAFVLFDADVPQDIMIQTYQKPTLIVDDVFSYEATRTTASGWFIADSNASETVFDLTGKTVFTFVYQADATFDIRIMWGAEPDGYNEWGPYWSEADYADRPGGALLFEGVSKSTTPKELSIDLEDMTDPGYLDAVNNFEYTGDPMFDPSKVWQIVIQNTKGPIHFTKIRFE